MGRRVTRESDLFHQAQTLLGWRDLERGAAAAPESAVERDSARARGCRRAVCRQGLAGAGRGSHSPRRPRPGPRAAASPALADRVLAAAAARLAVSGGEPPPLKLAVLAAALAHITMRRAGTEGEDAELVGFAAAISAVDDAVAEAVLDAAREQPATAVELAALAAELSVLTSTVEIAALANLLNAMADGEAALRRLRDLAELSG